MGGPDPQEVRQRILELTTSVYAFSALISALELGILDELSAAESAAEIGRRTGAPEELVVALLDVALSLGLVRRTAAGFACTTGAAALVGGKAKEILQGDLRSTHLQSADLIDCAGRRRDIPLRGWQYSDHDLLKAQGVRSTEAVGAFSRMVFPQLEGLEARLTATGGTILDVGTGVARKAIEICRQFPNVHVVGIDPLPHALALARRNVAASSLEDRIELRSQRLEDLVDHQRFDLIWIPVMFLNLDVAARGLARAIEALRPGGWAVLESIATEGEGLQEAVLRLVALLYGSPGLFPERAAALLRTAGYEDIVVLPAVPGVAPRVTVGRRPVGA
jgi:SAM-dependent methyltransferase